MRIKQSYFGILLICVFLLCSSIISRPSTAQNQQLLSGISQPVGGATVRGEVEIKGIATDYNFLRYEIAFFSDDNPDAGWRVFFDGDQEVQGDVLAVWNTDAGQNENSPVYPDGSYQLRLRIVKKDFNYLEYFVGQIQVRNGYTANTEATEIPVQGRWTAVPQETVFPTPEDDGTPLPDGVEPSPVPVASEVPTRIIPTVIPTVAWTPPPTQPVILPSLTPYPTQLPNATAEAQQAISSIPDDNQPTPVPSAPDELVDSVLDFDYGVMGDGFQTGAKYTLLAFLAFGSYILIRTLLRWVWRQSSR